MRVRFWTATSAAASGFGWRLDALHEDHIASGLQAWADGTGLRGGRRAGIIPAMLRRCLRKMLGAAGLALLAWPAPTLPAQGPGGGQEQASEIRILEAEIQRLQSQLDELRANVPVQSSAVVTVPAGARQGTPFDLPDPNFGPSDWVPSWGTILYQPPQARPRTPRELGELPPPLDSALAFPEFVPGSLLVRHGLGPAEVTVTLVLVSADGGYQLDSNRVVIRGSSPPDGTFTILNYNEHPLVVRWAARRVP